MDLCVVEQLPAAWDLKLDSRGNLFGDTHSSKETRALRAVGADAG